jgi:hypothetical protein
MSAQPKPGQIKPPTLLLTACSMAMLSGHRQSTAARSLGLPILVLSKHPEEEYTLPFPDFYQVRPKAGSPLRSIPSHVECDFPSPRSSVFIQQI